MIKVDLSFAVGLYLFIFLGLLFCFWVFIRGREFFEDLLSLRPSFVWCCSVCTYTYFTSHKTEISVCPRCGCYNKNRVQKKG